MNGQSRDIGHSEHKTQNQAKIKNKNTQHRQHKDGENNIKEIYEDH